VVLLRVGKIPFGRKSVNGNSQAGTQNVVKVYYKRQRSLAEDL